MAVQPGRLVHRISIYRRAPSTKVQGVVVPGVRELIRGGLAAEVRTATGVRLERLFASHIAAEATHVVKTHAGISWSVKHQDEVIWHDPIEGDRTLMALGVADPDGKRIEQVIAASEPRP